MTNFYRFFEMFSQFFGYVSWSLSDVFKKLFEFSTPSTFTYQSFSGCCSHKNWMSFIRYLILYRWKKKHLHKINTFFAKLYISSVSKKIPGGDISPSSLRFTAPGSTCFSWTAISGFRNPHRMFILLPGQLENRVVSLPKKNYQFFFAKIKTILTVCLYFFTKKGLVKKISTKVIQFQI